MVPLGVGVAQTKFTGPLVPKLRILDPQRIILGHRVPVLAFCCHFSSILNILRIQLSPILHT